MENPLLELQEYENLRDALKKAKGPLQATGTWIPRRCISCTGWEKTGDFHGSWW